MIQVKVLLTVMKRLEKNLWVQIPLKPQNYNMSRGLPLGKLEAEVHFEPWPLPPWADFLNAVYFRQGLTCALVNQRLDRQ